MMLVNGSAHASTVARSEQLSIGTMSGPCVAIDIGGTKIDIAIVSVEGTILDREMLPTDQDADDSLLFSAVMETAGRLIRRAPHAPTVCGVGCGGPMAREGVTVSPLNIPAWRSFPLRARLREALDLPVAVDNDAKALALAEGWLGAARNVDSYVAMVVSTVLKGMRVTSAISSLSPTDADASAEFGVVSRRRPPERRSGPSLVDQPLRLRPMMSSDAVRWWVAPWPRS